MTRFAWVAMLAVLLGSTVSFAQDAERLLKAAMNTELVDGDLKAAIEQYRVVAERADRAVAARALVRMAECYQKLGDSEARKIYERLAREFSDQPEAAIARTRLRTAPSAANAGVMLKALPKSDGLPGTISADGRYMSFTNWNDDGKLAVRDVRTGIDRSLTDRADFNIGLSAISRDAALVAYEAYGGGCDGKGKFAALCLVSLAENERPTSRVLVTSEDIVEIAPMAWAADNRTIAVSLRRKDRTAQIGLVSVPEGSVRVLQSVDWRGPTRIFFSPDGRDLVFDLPANEASDDRHIVMLAVDGSRGLTAVEHASQNIAMGWTPDGSELLFASDRGGTMGLWAQAFAAGRPQGAARFVRGDLGGAWSLGVTRDGALYFGVRRNDREISVTTVDLESGKQLSLPVRPIRRFVGTNLMPDWSSDGRHLAYVSQRGFNPTNNNGRLIGIRDMTTGAERELHPKLLYFGPISWSPDDRTLLTAGTDIKGRSGVFTIDAQTADVTFVVPGTVGAAPQWSADGKRVLYRALNEGGQGAKIVERDLASGAERDIHTGNFAVFTVSPDGRSLAVIVGNIQNANGNAVLEIDIQSGEAKDLLRAAAGERFAPFIAPRWTPDGRAILVRKRSPNELWIVPTTGAQPRKVEFDARDWSFGGVGQFSVHPDGRRIAFLSGSISNEVVVLENFLAAPSVRR
jgi:Tol biopolymer transport system component